MVDAANSEVLSMSLVRSDASEAGTAEIITIEVEVSEIKNRLVSKTAETLPAGRARGLHLAEDHAEYGPVTYLQEITEGSFFVYVGPADELQEHVFRPGDWVGFIDNQGLGHASKVGPEGCSRNFHLLKGQLGQGI